MEEDFHGGPVVGSLPINAEDMGLILGLGWYHMPGDSWAGEPQLLKPMPLEPVLHSKRTHYSEKPVHCN